MHNRIDDPALAGFAVSRKRLEMEQANSERAGLQTASRRARRPRPSSAAG